MAHQQTLTVDTELIGDFRIMDLLGSGGFANTYLAMDLTLGREVAIKEFFPSELAVRADSQSVSVKSAAQKVQFNWAKGRFVREAKTLAKFRHPSVVRVFRVFNANDTAYMVLEFVRGSNMETWLKRIQRRPDQDELDHFLPPLLDALEVVHDAGILHRDIKPANIYIRETERTPVLLDFGAAKYAASSAGDQTATTAAIVSKGYSPHEAYSTDAHLQGPWTDIYGLAATLHRGLTGSAPMESTTRIMQDDFVPLDERPDLAGRYRPAFLQSLNRALAVMPKDRPQLISEWRAELYPDLTTSQPAASPAPAREGRAEWHPLSDTPEDATTIYTGGSSRPSGTIVSQSRVQVSQTPEKRGNLLSDISAITAATRPALQNALKKQSRTVVTGWLLAIAGAGGLAAPLLFGGTNQTATVDVAQPPSVSQVVRVPADVIRPAPRALEAAQGKTAPTPEQIRAGKQRAEADRQKEIAKQRDAEKQREVWRTKRLALQADLARKRSEENTRTAERRAQERIAREKEAEQKRLAKRAEEKRARQVAAANAARAERERKERLAREAAKKESLRLAEEEQKQRLAAEQKDREERRKAAQAAREQERQRLARRAEDAERARAKREAQKKGEEERKYAALNPTPPPSVAKPAQLDRKPYLTKVQTVLKDSKCYSGTVNGELNDTESALDEFNKAYKGKAKSLNLKTASADDYDAWLTWFRSLEKFGCITPRVREEFAKPKPSWKKKKTRKKVRRKPSSKKTKKAKSKAKKSKSRKSAKRKRSTSKPSYGGGSNSRGGLLRGTR